ncbi:hypothetical protein LJB42_004173 [Komagataella kurtzmanii]|nr:hypothetical protein LJB42_004173 [Komagataella kurtzmanii]
MDFKIANLIFQERELTNCLRELAELETKRKRQIYRVVNYMIVLKNADLGNGNSLKNVSTHKEDHLKVLDELRETKGQLSHLQFLLDNANLEKKNLEKTYTVRKAILESKVEMGLKTIKRLKERRDSAQPKTNNPFAQNSSTPFATTPVLNKITIFKTAAEVNGRKIKSPARHTPLPKKSGSKIPLLDPGKQNASPSKAIRSPRPQNGSRIGRTLLATSTPDATNTKLYGLNQTSPLRSLLLQNKDKQNNDITRTSIFNDDDDDNEDEISDHSFERKVPTQSAMGNNILTDKSNRKKRKLFSTRNGLKRFLADHDRVDDDGDHLDNSGPASPILKKLKEKQILSPLKKKNQAARVNIFGN